MFFEGQVKDQIRIALRAGSSGELGRNSVGDD
jgi:hypothetical protein